jgi:LysM repeat protein
VATPAQEGAAVEHQAEGTRTGRGRHAAAGAALVALTFGASANYEVGPGDTLSEIAARSGTTTTALASANGISNPDHIRIGQRLTVPSTPGRAVSPSQAEVARLIEEISRANGWSPAFVKALAWQESGWNNEAVSSAGAIGIMQVMPDTGDFVSRHLVGRELDLHDPRDNVIAGVAFLEYLWELTGGDVHQTLAGYYQGLASVRQNGLYPSTESYIANVLALRERFR